MSLLEFGLGIGVKGTGNVLPIGFARPSVEHTFRDPQARAVVVLSRP